MNSVQRSNTVILDVVKLLHEEFEKRLGNRDSDVLQSIDSDLLLEDDAIFTFQDYFRKRFVIVRSEEAMIETMRRSVALNEAPFDIIISPFGCDSKSLPPHVMKLLDVEEEEDAMLPKRLPKRVPAFNSPAPATPTLPSEP